MPKVAKVEAVGPARLYVHWQDGRAERIDLAGVAARWPRLAEPAIFAAVAVTGGGHGIGWPGGPALDGEALATMAAIQRGWTGAAFMDWIERMGLSVRGAADALGVSPSTIHEQGRKRTIDQVVMLAARALEADRIVFDAVNRPRRPGAPQPIAFADTAPVAEGDVREGEADIFGWLAAPGGRLCHCADAVRLPAMREGHVAVFGLAYWYRDGQARWRQAHVDLAIDPVGHHRRMLHLSPEIVRCQLLLAFPLETTDARDWKAATVAAFRETALSELPDRPDTGWVQALHPPAGTDLMAARLRRDAAFGALRAANA